MNDYREELALSGQKLKIAFFHNRVTEARTMVGLHWHDAYEVLYVRRGWGEQRINVERHAIRPGDTVLLCPGELHATDALSPKGCDIDVLQFSAACLWDAEALPHELRSGVMRQSDDHVERLMEAFEQTVQADDDGSAWRMVGLTQLLVGILLGACEHGTEEKPCSAAMRAVCDYLEVADEVRLEAVASRFGYSAEHLSRRFHKETGVTFRVWCDRVRMRRALNLLGTSEQSIAQIAERLGYSDDNSFIRAFKRMYGITPSACRRQRMSIPSL